jgi:predicted esterase
MPIAARSLLKKILVSLLRILAGVPVVSLLICGLLFLFLGATLKGRSVGLSAVILGFVLYCSVGYWNSNWFQGIRGRLYAIFLPISLLLFGIPMILAPSGDKTDGCVRNRFLNEQGKFSRYSPWNVIPEVDQIKVGISLMPFGEKYVDFAKASRMRSLLLSLYKEMDEDSDFRALGSVMYMAYRELFRMDFRTNHYFLFLPETTNGEKLPCVIFLHGLGGNIKPCIWVLSKLSKQKKCIVIAPTFGLGNWDGSGSAEFVVNVAHEAINTLPLDPKNIFLMGYSNGAVGVTRAAIKEPGLFKGLIYLSAVTEDDLFATKEFSAFPKSHKILFLHGDCDERIPISLIKGTVASLKHLGCDVRMKTYDKEDHYLFFSRQNAILSDIIECMAGDQ